MSGGIVMQGTEWVQALLKIQCHKIMKPAAETTILRVTECVRQNHKHPAVCTDPHPQVHEQLGIMNCI